MQGGDLPHNREAEPAAVGMAAQQAMEALKDPLALVAGMLGPSSLTADSGGGPPG